MESAMKRSDLRLVPEIEKKQERWQLEGYQRLDDKMVMYRRYVPVTRELNSILMHIFDFNSFQAIIIIDAKGYKSDGTAAAMELVHFSDFENRQAIRDAHQALMQLGGSPPPLSVVFGHPDPA